MNLRMLPVPEALKADVECIRIVEHSGEGNLAINVCLNGLPGIVFQHRDGHSPLENITTPSGWVSGAPTLFVYGQMTEPGVMNHRPGAFTTTQIVLKSHALQTLLGLNASALTNSLVALTEFSAGDLNEQLLDAPNEHRQMGLLNDFLLKHLKREPTRDRLVEESLRLIQHHPAAITVKALLECLSISERQFERRFNQTVGLPPQFYIRVKRFNAAVRLMNAGRFATLTDVAHALNYYDQSHFIREIRAFSGVTPGSLSQKGIEPGQSVIAYT
jgi:AraC-like DNA-binding protein